MKNPDKKARKQIDSDLEVYKRKSKKDVKSQGEKRELPDVGNRELEPTKGKMPDMGKKSKDQASREVASQEIGRKMGKSGKGKSKEAAKAEKGTQFSKPQGDNYPNPAKENKNDKY